jgi:ABC-type dipeptide/oligopeptide/nickel transport system permease subunit
MPSPILASGWNDYDLLKVLAMATIAADASTSGPLTALGRRSRRVSPWKRFRRNRLALVGLAVLGLLVAAAIFAPLVAPFDPDAVSYQMLASPSAQHWLGTDDVGRDMLSRLIFASRVSLTLGVVVSILTVTIGTTIGCLAGYYGGKVDGLLSSFINVMLSIPLLPLAMVLGAFLETNLVFLILILGLITWTGSARLIRGEFLSLREREYVTAARVLGAGDLRIIVRHILPNAVPLIIVSATLMVATAILTESALSYLGCGIQPPTASWGNMLQDGQRYLREAPALAIYPGALISITVMCINFVGDGLRDALDPRLGN